MTVVLENLYHIPTYRLFEYSGLKIPISKVPFSDSSVSPSSLMKSSGVMIFSVEVLKMKKKKRVDHQRISINKKLFTLIEVTDMRVLPYLENLQLPCCKTTMVPCCLTDIREALKTMVVLAALL
ncbi:hypothetical protein Goklo_020092, partial [Gossypium klotzschianum]|nr:hypothetical protein [Gossypium klotzschianum]